MVISALNPVESIHHMMRIDMPIFKGFLCCMCGKPFFVVSEDDNYIKEYPHCRLVDIPVEVVENIDLWCDCKE